MNPEVYGRLSCHAFRHDAVRLQLHALACNLAGFLRTLALPVAAPRALFAEILRRIQRLRPRPPPFSS